MTIFFELLFLIPNPFKIRRNFFWRTERAKLKVGVKMVKKYDVIVIGGGPSGLMASIAAGENGAKVLLVDKGTKLGRKLAISGGGRCNVTNRLPVEEIIKHIPGNGRFLYSAFSEFNNEDIISFFENLGIQLKEEDHAGCSPCRTGLWTLSKPY